MKHEELSSKPASVRAAPRRARKDPNEAPVFLQKTYQMIDTAPQAVAGWSEDGDTFIVKDMDEFANLLPRFFKHRNFRSFVRQLNFYGFRKLRTDGALISERPAHWWEFRHEKFLRGRPELLTQIKRANHYETSPSDQVEIVEDLKSEVSVLRDRIDEMTGTIDKLTDLVDALMRERNEMNASMGAAETSSDLMYKKRRLQQAQDGLGMIGDFDQEEHATSILADEAVLLSQLSIDSGSVGTIGQDDFERSFSGFDFSEGDVPVVESEAVSHPVTMIKTESGEVDMPPVAPLLASAAIGAFFTKLAQDSHQQQKAQEGVPLMRTSSMNGGIAVNA